MITKDSISDFTAIGGLVISGIATVLQISDIFFWAGISITGVGMVMGGGIRGHINRGNHIPSSHNNTPKYD